jgi:hypothetical protein
LTWWKIRRRKRILGLGDEEMDTETVDLEQEWHF